MSNKPKSLVSAQDTEKFQVFLFEMDDVLESFLSEARSLGVTFDYSLTSLDLLETYILAQLNGRDDERLKNRAARYIGEVFRKTVGGKWELCQKDRKYLYFNLPVLSGYSDSPIEFCPIDVISDFVVKKELGTLRRAVEAHLEFKR
jgi:hypothetical protein